jgi:hypothetical protein
MVVLTQRVRGRFCYGPLRAYAILSIKLACVKIGMALSMAGGDPDFSGFAAETLLDAIEQTNDPEKLWDLAQALSAVPRQLSAADAEKAVAQIIAVIERTTRARTGLLWEAWEDNARQLEILAEALQAVPGELAPADAQRAFAQILAAVDKTTDPTQLDALGSALILIGCRAQ